MKAVFNKNIFVGSGEIWQALVGLGIISGDRINQGDSYLPSVDANRRLEY